MHDTRANSALRGLYTGTIDGFAGNNTTIALLDEAWEFSDLPHPVIEPADL